jgi:hypothetical protein
LVRHHRLGYADNQQYRQGELNGSLVDLNVLPVPGS